MTVRSIALAVFCALQGIVLQAQPGFTMRIDDNHTPEQWRRVAGIFEKQGIRCSFAVNVAWLSDAQGACLKELSDRGHVIMDHMPNHSFYVASYADGKEFERTRRLPFAVEADEKTRTVRFRCEVDRDCPKNRHVWASIEGDVVRFKDDSLEGKTAYAFVGLAGKSGVFGLQESGGSVKLLDFWRRPIKEKLHLEDVEVVLYDQSALQPCDDLLRELARITRERFDHFGLPHPTIWVRPGGWDPGVTWDRIERIYGREFGYVGADSRIGTDVVWGGSRWTTGYDEMYFFDQGPEITPEQLVERISKRISNGKCHVTLSHMWCDRLPGGFGEYCEKTERFVSLLSAKKIPGLTMEESLKDRFSSAYVQPSSPAVRDRLEWFRDQKLCLMMHFGLYSTLGITESWPLVTQDAQWARADIEWTVDDAQFKRQYFSLNRAFNPIRFNADDWAKTAKSCGFRYLAFTVKHHDGFCLYDTKYTDYKTTDSSCPFSENPNADIVRKLFDVCRAQGLGISAYFSKADWHHEDFWENRGIGLSTTRWATYDVVKQPEKWNRFREFTKNQILEVVRDYGPIDILWLDGGWVFPHRHGHDLRMKEIIAEARKVQPNLISVDRMANDACMDIETPEQCVPDEPIDHPWESCITMADGWGYHYDDKYKSVNALIHTLVDVVAKGGNLALNVGPMPDGRLPRPAIERMEAMGRWLTKNGAAIYGTRTATPCSIRGWRFTKGKDGRVFAICLWKEGAMRVSRRLLNVDSRQGKVRRIVHLATGREMPFHPARNDYEKGVLIEFPEGFVQDPDADAFVVDYEM